MNIIHTPHLKYIFCLYKQKGTWKDRYENKGLAGVIDCIQSIGTFPQSWILDVVRAVMPE